MQLKSALQILNNYEIDFCEAILANFVNLYICTDHILNI